MCVVVACPARTRSASAGHVLLTHVAGVRSFWVPRCGPAHILDTFALSRRHTPCPRHGNASGRATRCASVRPRAAAWMPRATWPFPQPHCALPVYLSCRIASLTHQSHATVLCQGEQSRRHRSFAAQPPSSLSTPSRRVPPRPHLLLHSVNTSAPSPGHQTTPSLPRRGCSGRGRVAPARAPGEAASGSTFSHNRSRVSPLASLAPHPAISGQEPPPVSSWTPAGTTLRAASSFQGDLCKGRVCL
jgi:hypothetical protein